MGGHQPTMGGSSAKYGGSSTKYGGVIHQVWGGHQPTMGGSSAKYGGVINQLWGGHQPSMGGHQPTMGGSSAKYGGVINQLWGGGIFPPVCTGSQNRENYFSNTFVLPSVNRTAGPIIILNGSKDTVPVDLHKTHKIGLYEVHYDWYLCETGLRSL